MLNSKYEIKRGKYLSIKIPEATRFARTKSLGDNYTKNAVRERISGKRIVQNEQKIISVIPKQTTRVPKLLIDIETKIKQANSPGFEHWATIYNIKQMAQTLIFLRDNGIGTYDELNAKIQTLDSEHGGRSTRIKEIEARQKEISELQRHIGTYGKVSV